MIAIQRAKGGFDIRWIKYCDSHNIDYKIVDCYKNDIIHQLKDCEALMWQFYQGNSVDIIMAKGIVYSLEHSGIIVFPDFRTSWHFDDKIGQKYLLEALDIPLAPTWVFYSKDDALDWIQQSTFPKVFKLRGGAGSQNVRLVSNKNEALRLIRTAFGRGFPQYDPLASLKDRWRLFRNKKSSLDIVIKGLVRFIVPPPYTKIKGRERGYIYFQEFIPENNHDIRVVVIGEKAFAIKRLVRENDFRASGSGSIIYERSSFDENTIRLSFVIAEKLQSQCIAFDFVQGKSEIFLLEISYGFTPSGYDLCPGYWDKDLIWHDGEFNPYGWMVEDLVKSIRKAAKDKEHGA